MPEHPAQKEAAIALGERLKQAGATVTPAQLMAAAQLCATQFRLPFGRQSWHGQAGNWAGTGVGSSIDFQDHRPYVPGDDPRYINWQAYARSGHYTMKLYQEEVRPQVDLILDVSPSMFAQGPKAERTVELFYFVCHCAWRSAVQLNVTLANGSTTLRPQMESLRRADWSIPVLPPQPATAPDPQRLHLSARAMRVVISDFLFEQEPAAWLAQFERGGSRSVLFSIYTKEEMQPDWLGDQQLLDCESNERVQHHFTREELDAYCQRYNTHFALWEHEAARHRANFLRIAAEDNLPQQFLNTAVPQGGLELCS